MASQSLIKDRYRLEDRLGIGGMGEVWRAHDLLKNQPVAIKKLLLHYAADGEVRGRFQDEAKVASALSSPRIVKVYDLGEENSQPFIVMELVEGGSLEQFIATQAPLPLTHALLILRQIAEGVEVFHRQGYIHRDLKPGNILLGHGKEIKIADFGLAYQLDSLRRTQEGKVWATFAYSAPEQRENSALSSATDIYALGVILYELLTKEYPPTAGGESLRDRLLRFDVPAGGIRLLEEMLHPTPGKRPRDAAALLRRIDECLRASRLQAPTQPHPVLATRVSLVPRAPDPVGQRIMAWLRAQAGRLALPLGTLKSRLNEQVTRKYASRDALLPPSTSLVQGARSFLTRGLSAGIDGAVLGLTSGTLGGMIGGLVAWKGYWLIRSVENGALKILAQELARGIFSNALVKVLLDPGSWWLPAGVMGALLGILLGVVLGIGEGFGSRSTPTVLGRLGRIALSALGGAWRGMRYGIIYRIISLLVGLVLGVILGEGYRTLLVGTIYSPVQEIIFWVIRATIGFAILGALDGAFGGALFGRARGRPGQLMFGVLLGAIGLATGSTVVRLLSETDTRSVAGFVAWLTQDGIRAQLARSAHEAAVGATGGGFLSLMGRSRTPELSQNDGER